MMEVYKMGNKRGDIKGYRLPHIHQKVFMVPSVQAQVITIEKETHKQDHQDLDGTFSSIHKVTIKNIWVIPRGEAILWKRRGEKQAITKIYFYFVLNVPVDMEKEAESVLSFEKICSVA